jgi:hypothetical protein
MSDNGVLLSMDRDIFARCTRLGRQVAEGIADALEGRPWIDFQAARLYEDLLQTAGGVGTARAVLEMMDRRRSFPELPGIGDELAIVELDQILRTRGTSRLDMVLVDVAKRGVLSGASGAEVAEGFFFALMCRHALEGRGGILETRGVDWYSRHSATIRRLLAPVTQKAARELVNRPDARTLSLTRSDRISPDDDLRGSVVAP